MGTASSDAAPTQDHGANAPRGRLSPAQVEHFQTKGYLLFDQPVFPAKEFATLSSLFEENLEKYGEDQLDTIHFRDERLLEFLLSDFVLDIVEPIVGPDIGLWSSHFISKPPRTGRATPWHEDSSYWNGRISTMAGVVTVWLALDPVTKANGCMRVIPESHRNGYSEYEEADSAQNYFPLQIKPDEVDESAAVDFLLEPGYASLHEARMIHGAYANTSDIRRAGYTMRYFPTTSLVFPEKNPGHMVWLARGRDHAGNDFVNG